MPPMNCERAVVGLMIRPAANTPSSRGTRTSPVSASTRTSANWAPKAWRASRSVGLDRPRPCRRRLEPSGGTSPPWRRAPRQRLAGPRRPPSPTTRCPSSRRRRGAGGSALSPISTRTRSGVDAERVGGDLGEHGARAGADVGGADRARRSAPSGSARGGRLARPAVGRVGRGRRRRCRPASGRRGGRPARVAAGPAEALGALAQARDEVARAERQAALGIDVRLVADAQLDRVDAARRSPARPSPTPARTCPGTRRARASTTASARRAATSRWLVRRLRRRVHHARGAPRSARRTP